MSKSSSDKRSESERTRPDADRERSNAEQQSDYYYDDATGYEIYEDKDDEEDDANEELQNRER